MLPNVVEMDGLWIFEEGKNEHDILPEIEPGLSEFRS